MGLMVVFFSSCFEPDPVCAHCPHIEPQGGVTDGDGGAVESICLHSLAYLSGTRVLTAPTRLYCATVHCTGSHGLQVEFNGPVEP